MGLTRCFSARPSVVCLLATLLFATSGFTGSADEPVDIELTAADRATLERIGELVDINSVQGFVVRASATRRQLAQLDAAGIGWRSLPKLATTAAMCPQGWPEEPQPSWSCYPSYDQYVDFMRALAREYPQRCRLERLGWSANLSRPHELLALKITSRPGVEEAEPGVFLSSTMHGDETTGFVLLLRLAHELLNQYDADSEITALVDGTEIWINPLANPDGTYFAGDETVAGAVRQLTTSTGGRTSVNANRNFPDFDEGPHPDGNAWWPETVAMMAFAEEHSIALAANLHGGAEVVNYPWDTIQRRHTDTEWFIELSRAYADLAQTDSPGGYMTDLSNGITNGWDWYTVAGGRQDYTTYYHGWREVTIEISATKLLPAEELDEHWQANRRAFYAFLDHAHRGIRGVVRDAGGHPLDATIEVVGHDRDEDRSAVTTDREVGDYHRLLLPGTYDLRFFSPGYEPNTVYGIAVADGSATEVDVVLHPSSPRRVLGRVR